MDKKKTVNEYVTINASHFNRIMPDTKNREFKIDIIWNNISFAKSNIFNTVSHIHSFYELYCVMDGSIKIIMNNKEHLASRGSSPPLSYIFWPVGGKS